MADREILIGNLGVGDIFHAEAPNGASLICIVLSVDEGIIQARRVTTQENLAFNRKTGVKVGDDRERPCAIDSVAPLPAEIHNAILDLDKKNAAIMAMDEKSRFQDLERLKLADVHGKALIFIGSHYPENPLPPRRS